jgi:ATP-binding cassette, subfamily C (CFTR/MRP), member 1
LHHVDYIYNIINGEITEQGSYERLMKDDGAFAKLMREFSGAKTTKDSDSDSDTGVEGIENMIESRKARTEHAIERTRKKLDQKMVGKAAGTGKLEGRLMKAEKRTVGSVDRKGTYNSRN